MFLPHLGTAFSSPRFGIYQRPTIQNGKHMRRRRTVDIVGKQNRRSRPPIDLDFDALPVYDPRDPPATSIGSPEANSSDSGSG